MALPNKMFLDGHLGGYLQGGDPASWCPNLWRWALQTFQVQSTLDMGCGEGYATRAFRDLGCRSFGIDGCLQAIHDSAIPECVQLHDFIQGPFCLPEPVDMIWTCEFLEHVEEVYLSHVLNTLSQAGKVILLTHGLPGQKGHHHVNCQPGAYWIEHVEKIGYSCDVALSTKARIISLQDYHNINHFAESGLVFVKQALSTSALSLPHRFACKLKSWRIDWGFRRSFAFLKRKWQRRMAKRGIQI